MFYYSNHTGVKRLSICYILYDVIKFEHEHIARLSDLESNTESGLQASILGSCWNEINGRTVEANWSTQLLYNIYKKKKHFYVIVNFESCVQ